MTYLIITFLSSFFMTLGVLFFLDKPEQIECYPYLKQVFREYEFYKKQLLEDFTNSKIVKEFDLKLERMNSMVKNHRGFLIDCSFCVGCKTLERLD